MSPTGKSASPGKSAGPGAVILAGGRSERMGRHKALLPLGRGTFIENIVDAYRAAGVTDLLVATHCGVVGETAFPALEGVGRLVLDQATDSPLHTLWRALDRIQSAWRAFFVHPVDHPLVRPGTLAAMARAFCGGPARIVQPCFRDRGGHPVLLDVCLAQEIRTAPPDQGLRSVVRADPDRVCRLVVEDPGILQGVNRPEDLVIIENLLRREPPGCSEPN